MGLGSSDHRRQNCCQTARQWLDHDPLFLDTETTGIDNHAEICEIAVLDADGTALVDTLVRPTQPISAGARQVHGITDDDVRDAPTFAEVAPTLQKILDDREVVVYNADYDVRLMRQSAQALRLPRQTWNSPPRFHCAMGLYAQFHGDWNPTRQSYAWQKQHVAARTLRLVPPDDLHRARSRRTLSTDRSQAGWLLGSHPPTAIIRDTRRVPCASLVDPPQ